MTIQEENISPWTAGVSFGSPYPMSSGVPRRGVQPPHPEIPKALQNRAKLNPIVKTLKNCWI